MKSLDPDLQGETLRLTLSTINSQDEMTASAKTNSQDQCASSEYVHDERYGRDMQVQMKPALFPLQNEVAHSTGFSAFGYSDPYISGLYTAYGPQPFVNDLIAKDYVLSSCDGLSSCFVDNFLSRTTSSRGLTCSISYCDEIEWIVNVPSGRDTTTDPHCISFHSLEVCWLRNLVGLCKGKIASHTFSGPTKMKIQGCRRMKRLFPRAILQDLQNLEKLDVRWCYEMEEMIGREEGEGSNQSSSCLLPNLKHLTLSTLPELKSICEGKLMCDSLEDMTFQNWWERLEWEQSHLNTLFQKTYIKYTEW
ncbi:hypothetical protein P3S67_008387 [Capsicum chacoense]